MSSEINKYKCEECGISFKSLQELQEQITRNILEELEDTLARPVDVEAIDRSS